MMKMKRLWLILIVIFAVPLTLPLVALPLAAQDTTTLDGEAAIRIMAGHGHLNYTYCEGQLWITPTRLRFDSFLGSEHSFDLRRPEVKDFHAAHLFGFDYMKVDGGGHTYRLGIYPNLHGDFGDRFAFAEKAWKSFDTARPEVERTAAQRSTRPEQVRARLEKDGATLEFPAFAGPGVVWFRNEKTVTIWANGRAGGEAYGWILGKVTPGRLQVTAERVLFLPNEGSMSDMSFESPRSEVRIQNGAGGYPRLVVNVRSVGRTSIVLGAATGEPLVIKGKPAGNRVQFEDVAPLLRALGPQFPQMAAELLPKPVLVVTSEPGAEIFVDEQRRGVIEHCASPASRPGAIRCAPRSLDDKPGPEPSPSTPEARSGSTSRSPWCPRRRRRRLPRPRSLPVALRWR